MSLSCECGSPHDGDWWYYPGEDFMAFDLPRARRCCSCKRLIRRGDDCVKFKRERAPIWDIEERIYGDEVPLAPRWMCEECGGLFFSLSDLGFCISIGAESMRELAQEYAEIYGAKR